VKQNKSSLDYDFNHLRKEELTQNKKIKSNGANKTSATKIKSLCFECEELTTIT